VPNFGGFVARKKPACIDWHKNSIVAPGKELIFNSLLQKNDGLLLESIASKEAIPYEQAYEVLNQTVLNWNETMKAGQRVELEKIGFLFKDSTGNILFEQDRFFNLLLSSYGLSDFNFVLPEKITEQEIKLVPSIESPSFSGVANREQQEKKPLKILSLSKEKTPFEAENQQNSVKNETTNPSREKTVQPTIHFPWRRLAAAVLLPLGFFAYWIPMKTQVLETGLISISDFNPFHTTQESEYIPQGLNFIPKKPIVEATFEESTDKLPPELSVFNYKFNKDLYIPIRLSASSVSTEIVKTQNEPPQIATHVQKEKLQKAFHLIGGCFSSSENAENFVSLCQKENKSAFILDHKNGLYRVSVAQSSTMEEAKNSQAQLKAGGLETWLLKK